MRRRTRGDGGIASALNGLYSAMPAGAKLRESLVLAYWAEAVGPTAALASKAESIRDGVLFVRTRSSVWSQELTFLKSKILAELSRRVGKGVVKEIVFRAKGIEPATETPPAEGLLEDPYAFPSEDEIAAVVFSLDEQKAIRADLEALVTIPDEKIRQKIALRILRDRRIRRWRLNRGWQKCVNCDALHNTEETICPICRLCR